MTIDNDVKRQILNTILGEYKVRDTATEAIKELSEAYCELYRIKDNNPQLNLLPNIFSNEEVVDLLIEVIKNSRDSIEDFIKIKKDQLVKKYLDLDDVAEEAVKSALNGKTVCITAKNRYQIKKVGEMVLQYCNYKSDVECVSHESGGMMNVMYFESGGIINFLSFSEDNFIGRKFHNAFIYMQDIDIDDYFYNTYEKLAQRCRMK